MDIEGVTTMRTIMGFRDAGLLLTICLGIASAGWTETGRWEAGLNAGASIPVGSVGSDNSLNVADILKTSPRIEGSLFYQVQSALEVGLEAAYSVGHHVAGQPTIQGFKFDIDSDIHLHVFNLGPVVKMGPWIEVNGLSIKPYLIAGVNWSRFWTPDGSISLVDPVFGDIASSPVEGGSNDYFGLSGGGGIQFKVFRNVVFGAEARYNRSFAGQWIFRPSRDDAQFVIPTAHMAYLF